MVPAALLAAGPSGVLRVSAFVGRSQHTLLALTQGRTHRSGRSSRTVVSQARKGLSELLSLSSKSADGRSPLAPGKVSPRLEVPAHINRPPYADKGSLPDWDSNPQIHDAAGIEKMKAAGRLAAQVLDMAGSMAKPGVTTDEIDRAVHKMCVDNNAYPSPLNYGKFPKSVCTSVNECICHGIPDSRALRDGDIVNIDVTVFLNGYHGDTSRMFHVGNVSPAAKQLCEATKEALNAAIKVCGPGVPIKEIGRVINAVGDKYKYGVVKVFVGHGVGTVFHSWPHIAHHRNNEPGVLQKGMTFTIEPMFTAGRINERYWSDNWTAVTADGSLAAQWEHTLLVTDTGVEILTAYE